MATRHNVPAMKKLGGIIGTLLSTISDSADELGVSDETLHAAISSPNSPVVRRWIEDLVDKPRPTPFQRDMSKEGWTLIEDSGRNPALTLESIPKLVEVSYLVPGETLVNGLEIDVRSRGVLNACYGQQDGEFLLMNYSRIPLPFRKVMALTGTIWRRDDHVLVIPCLFANFANDFSICTGRPDWELRFTPLNNHYGDAGCLPGIGS